LRLVYDVPSDVQVALYTRKAADTTPARLDRCDNADCECCHAAVAARWSGPGYGHVIRSETIIQEHRGNVLHLSASEPASLVSDVETDADADADDAVDTDATASEVAPIVSAAASSLPPLPARVLYNDLGIDADAVVAHYEAGEDEPAAVMSQYLQASLKFEVIFTLFIFTYTTRFAAPSRW
jgi:hypothetical protein